jgi:hypothetical protein
MREGEFRVGRLRWDSSKNQGQASDTGDTGNSQTRVIVDLGNRMGLRSRLSRWLATIAGIVVLALAASAIHILPQLRNPFAETTTVRSGPVILKSITELHRYEAASGEFQVVVDVTSSSFLPSFLQGSETLFIGIGTENSYVDFSTLGPSAVQVSPDRLSATIKLPHAQLEPANLDVQQSYVFGQQQGLFTRLGNLFGGNPNGQQQVYVLATQKIEDAAKQSQLVADAERNTTNMLTGLLHSLGFTSVTVTYGAK